MHPAQMTKVIGGARYSTKTSTLIASDEYWDGYNFEHGGRNTFLYKTRLGAYFSVNLTQWQGAKDTLEPLSREEAIELYEGELTEHAVEWSEAFDAEPAEPEPSPGRPTLHGVKMIQTAVWLLPEQIAWLKERGGVGEQIRAMIEQARKE